MTANEQLEVITGEYIPMEAAQTPSTPKTASQTAVEYGTAFLLNQKVFPTVDGAGRPINQLASILCS